MSYMIDAELERRFHYHAPDDVKRQQHADVRAACKQLAIVINRLPECRETSLAMTNLEQTMFWMNAAVARY